MAGPSDTPSEASASRCSAADIARDWGVSRAYVSKCKAKGCPTDSLEAARAWRSENAKYGVGYRSKAAPSDAPPPTTPAAASSSPEPVRSLNLTSLKDSLNAAIQVEQEAHRLVADAQRNCEKTSILEARIRAYNNARDGRFNAERAFREEMERQNVLVPLDEAKALGRKGYDVMIPALRAVGSRIAPDCNPQDPLLAKRLIDAEIEAIIAQAREVYAS